MSDVETWVGEVFLETWGEELSALGSELPAAPFIPEALPRALAAGTGPDEAMLTAQVVSRLCRFLWTRNQYLSFDAADQSELALSVRRALRGLVRPETAEAALRLHRRELAAFVAARLGPAPREVTCAEYTPQLQLDVLGLTTAGLREPVLDVGCGPAAQLVRFLRTMKLDAEGLDRDAPLDVATQGDWLTHHYARKRWGSVLSHQAFSLHFLHHHLKQGDTAYGYAHAYMAIVRSLALGGRFAYAPGLPFIEALLDARMYRVHRLPFADALQVAALRDVERDTGLSLSHAVHVERLA